MGILASALPQSFPAPDYTSWSVAQMPDEPTPLDSYRLQWNPRFFSDLVVALSLGDAHENLPVAITKLSNPLRQRLGVRE
jgi:hypothetical protein